MQRQAFINPNTQDTAAAEEPAGDRPVLADRADCQPGRTFSNRWTRAGMFLLWPDQHAAFSRSRTIKDQNDPNMHHHTEFNGDGGSEEPE